MAKLSPDRASGSGGTLACGLMPSGRIDVRPGSSDEGLPLSPALQQRILGAFAAGRGKGVLYLGATEPGTELPPGLSYWRELGKAFVAGVCGALDPDDPASLVMPAPGPGDIYHPLSWTPKEAHRFLCESALHEQAGLELGGCLADDMGKDRA